MEIHAAQYDYIDNHYLYNSSLMCTQNIIIYGKLK